MYRVEAISLFRDQGLLQGSEKYSVKRLGNYPCTEIKYFVCTAIRYGFYTDHKLTLVRKLEPLYRDQEHCIGIGDFVCIGIR